MKIFPGGYQSHISYIPFILWVTLREGQPFEKLRPEKQFRSPAESWMANCGPLGPQRLPGFWKTPVLLVV